MTELTISADEIRSAIESYVESYSPEASREAAQRVARGKGERNAGKAQAALGALVEAAGGSGNLQPAIRDAVRAYCTVGEIAGALKEKFGAYQPPTRF